MKGERERTGAGVAGRAGGLRARARSGAEKGRGVGRCGRKGREGEGTGPPSSGPRPGKREGGEGRGGWADSWLG